MVTWEMNNWDIAIYVIGSIVFDIIFGLIAVYIVWYLWMLIGTVIYFIKIMLYFRSSDKDVSFYKFLKIASLPAWKKAFQFPPALIDKRTNAIIMYRPWPWLTKKARKIVDDNRTYPA